MKLSNPQYITDNTGKKLSVVLPIKEYEWITQENEGKLSIPPHQKSKAKALGLSNGKKSPVTNEQIDPQFNSNKWQNGHVLTPLQIKLVNEARKAIKENPDQFLDWDEARKTFNIE